MKPIEIARKLNISTSALRHYESWGIIPPVERAQNGYRMYTELHLAYFECIRAMAPGFGFELTSKALKKVLVKEVDDALWLVNEAQSSLHYDKKTAEKTIRILETEELEELDNSRKRKWMTIGEVSIETDIPSSAIRHWEMMGLLSPERDSDNGYRKFNRSLVRKVLMIRTLRSADYSLDTIKEVLIELDHHNVENARKVAQDSLHYLNQLNSNQFRGVHHLYTVCKLSGLLD
ncbi:MerR family transcriptional regulator [Sporosarcina beigongshangi]|uniref:MerR family transcriptional regulator n=1 Tax=Sporosarcina beigongshangi TaxID=2782538 RepID=UPI00193A0458|nr:MerR family transcriptional regulator [Sporosarcina beigongshangi]